MKLSLMTAAVAVALAGSATAASLVNPAGDASGVRPAVAVDEVGEDITGAWVGQGFVQKDERSKPVRVNCAVEGMQDGDRIGFEGVCRAFLVVKREIGAMLVRSGSTYTGTYKGSNVGIAELEGAARESLAAAAAREAGPEPPFAEYLAGMLASGVAGGTASRRNL